MNNNALVRLNYKEISYADYRTIRLYDDFLYAEVSGDNTYTEENNILGDIKIEGEYYRKMCIGKSTISSIDFLYESNPSDENNFMVKVCSGNLINSFPTRDELDAHVLFSNLMNWKYGVRL